MLGPHHVTVLNSNKQKRLNGIMNSKYSSCFATFGKIYRPFLAHSSTLVSKFASSNSAEAVGLLVRKNPQHAFLRRGSKTICPMSCFTACQRTQKWRRSRHFRTKFLGHYSPIVPPSATRFASIASDAGGLLWRKLERSKSLVLLQVGGLKCRW
jgi:hypothetical protein